MYFGPDHSPSCDEVCTNYSNTLCLEKPLYTSFVIINAEGNEFPTKSYRQTIDIARRELTGTKTEYVIRYSITPSGERKEIQKIYNIKK